MLGCEYATQAKRHVGIGILSAAASGDPENLSGIVEDPLEAREFLLAWLLKSWLLEVLQDHDGAGGNLRLSGYLLERLDLENKSGAS